MRGQYIEYTRAGAEIVAVSQGDPERTRAACTSRGIPFPCLADPERKVFRTYGLGQGSLLSVIGPKVILKGIRAAAHGHFMGKIEGDEFQMPGTFIVDHGIVRFAYYSKDAADIPPNDTLLSEVRKITRRTDV